MITVSSSDDYACIPVGKVFALQYYTSAINVQNISFGKGIELVEQAKHVERENDLAPGSSLLWRMKLRVVAEGPQQILISSHSPIPGNKPFEHVIHINEMCQTCKDEIPLWKSGHQLFCSRECALVGSHQQQGEWITYLATGYFQGTRTDMGIHKSDDDSYTFFNNKSNKRSNVSKEDGNRAWELVNTYIKTGVMHPTTKEDHPQCCDRGTTRIFFRGYAVEPRDVPELIEIFNKYNNKK